MTNYEIDKNKCGKDLLSFMMFRLKPLIIIACLLFSSSMFCLFIAIFNDTSAYKVLIAFLLATISVIIILLRYLLSLKRKVKKLVVKDGGSIIKMALNMRGDFFEIYNFTNNTSLNLLKSSVTKITYFKDFLILNLNNKQILYFPKNEPILDFFTINFSIVPSTNAFAGKNVVQEVIGIILMVFSIISFFILPFIISSVSHASFFGIGGFVRWQWIFFFGTFISILSLSISLIMKKMDILLKRMSFLEQL